MQGLSPVRFSGGVSGVTATRGANDPNIGDVCYDDTGANGTLKYVYIYNGGNSQVSPGYGVVASAAASGYTVTVSSVTDVDFLVGVCRNATITTGAYGWVVTQGHTPVQMSANNSAAAGGLLSLGTDGGFATKSVTFTAGNTCGKAQAALASGTSGLAYISVF